MDKFLAAFNLAALFAMSGALFAIGFIGVCRWLKWAPVNITINHHFPSSGSEG